MKEDLHLKQFTATSFMGISTDSPVVIDFSEARKNQGVTLLSGDQGTRKTSTLYGIMRMMGAAFGFSLKHTVNNIDETVNLEHTFEYEGADYIATLTGDRLTLKRFYKESNRWIPEGSPADTLKKIFGNLGVSPVFLKEQDGKQQIEWFKKNFGNGDAGKKEAKIRSSLDEAVANRKAVNKEIVELKGWLAQDDLFADYEKNLKKFATPVSADKEKKAFEEIAAKNKDYEKNKNGLSSLKEDHDDVSIRIKRLREELVVAEAEQTILQTRIDAGEKWLDANKHIPVEYEKINKAWMNLSKTIADQSRWKEVIRKKKQLDDSEDTVISVNALIDTLRNDLLALTSTYLPKIKGLEIKVKSQSLDNESEDEGIFYHSKSLAQLSESEFAEMWLLIWKDKEVSFVFIENISSYGSAFVKLLNDLVKKGEIKVFASSMDRKKKDMEISFETKID